MTNAGATRRAQPAFTRTVADSGSIMMSARSLVAAMESTPVVSTRAITTERDVLKRSMARRAKRSNAPR